MPCNGLYLALPFSVKVLPSSENMPSIAILQPSTASHRKHFYKCYDKGKSPASVKSVSICSCLALQVIMYFYYVCRLGTNIYSLSKCEQYSVKNSFQTFKYTFKQCSSMIKCGTKCTRTCERQLSHCLFS